MANFRSLTALRKYGVAKAAFHSDGSLASVEFFPPAPVESKSLAQTEKRVDLVPGTNFPADKTPLNPLDTVLHVPKYDASEADA